MALTRITKGVIKPNENYDTHNINSTGIVTAIGLDVNGNGDISGNLSVGGVLTYEDVTSIDSVGIITARDGIHVGAGLSVVGVSTFSGDLYIAENIIHTGDTDTKIRFTNDEIQLQAGGTTRIQTSNIGARIDTTLLLYGAAGNPGRLRLQEGGALSEIMVARNSDSNSFLYFKTEIAGTTATRVVIDESGHFRPFTDSTYDLGINGTRWRRVFADTYFGNGNLGILTATNIDLNGDLDVDGHTNLDNVSIVGVTTHNGQSKFYGNGGAPLIWGDTGYSGHLSFDGSNNAVIRAASGKALIFQTDHVNTRMTIGSQGNVSIEKDLDVDGHTNLDNVSIAGVSTFANEVKITPSNSSSYTTHLNYNNNGTNFITCANSGATHFRNSSSGGTAMIVQGSTKSVDIDSTLRHLDDTDTLMKFGDNTVSFITAGSERLLIDSNGKFLVGIHTSSEAYTWAPTARFAVENAGDASSIHFGQRVGGSVDPAIMMLRRGGSTPWHHHVGRIYTDYNPTIHFQTSFASAPGSENFQTQMVMKHNAGVGIATNNPSTSLHILGAGGQRQDMLRLQHTGQRNFYIQGQWGNTDVGDSNGILQYTDGGGIAFRSGATGDASMIVSQSNKVGIHTNNPSVNLHAFMANTTNASLSWGANCGQIFRNEGSELAFGLQNTNPYPFYIQARTNANTARQITLNPAGGAVAVNTNNSFSRAFQVRGTIGVLSPAQVTVLDIAAGDSQNTTISSYHTSGSDITLRTNYSGAGVQNRLHINGSGSTFLFTGTSAGNPIGIIIKNTNTANYSHARLRLESQNNAKASDIYTDVPNDALRLQYNSTNSVYIKDTGRVGIQTSNPQSALHVRGAGGIRVDTLGNSPTDQNDTYISDALGNPLISGTPWFTTDTYAWQGSYSGIRYHWIKVVKSLGSSAIGYIEYMAHGDSNYPRHLRGTIGIAKYADGSISCCHDQQTHEPGNVSVVLCGDGTVWMRLANYDWNSDFRFRLVYGESVTLNSNFNITGSSDNSYGRIDPGGGGSPVNASHVILPGANVRYSVSGDSFNPSSSDSTYSGDTHRFFKIDVANQLIKGSGSFRIDHPLAGMSTSHYLQHSFVEGPQADNIYRGKTTLVAGISTVNIDTASNMTDGTFVELNTDVQCFTTNETGWTPIKGSVSGNKLTILAQDNSCTDTISWMVVGERQDDNIKNKADWTDSDGKVIVELPKPNVGFAGTEAPYDEYK